MKIKATVRYQAKTGVGEPVGMPQATADAAFKQLRGHNLKGCRIDRIFVSHGGCQVTSWNFGEERPQGF